jgi:hypothetical protein
MFQLLASFYAVPSPVRPEIRQIPVFSLLAGNFPLCDVCANAPGRGVTGSLIMARSPGLMVRVFWEKCLRRSWGSRGHELGEQRLEIAERGAGRRRPTPATRAIERLSQT